MKFKKYFREKHKKPRTICLPINYLFNRCVSRFFDCLAHPNLSATLAIDQKYFLSCCQISYQSLAECHLP